MSVLGTVRRGVAVSQQAYIDTPYFDYAAWMQYLYDNDKAIGDVSKLSSTPNIAVIGGGASGLCAAYELARAGCNVTVFEAKNEVKGRCDSYVWDSGDIAELGAMRFPPSEFLLNYYLQTVFDLAPNGIEGLPDFPDPGVNPTWICLENDTPESWQSSEQTPCPPGFETVYNGWSALCSDGITQNGVEVLPSPATMTGYLVAGNASGAATAWQQWIDMYGQTSFYTAIYGIFTGASGYDIPNGTAWTEDDFLQFATLGIGGGGFGPLYNANFLEIMRLVVNNLETTQKFFKDGIEQLPFSFRDGLPTSGNAIGTVYVDSPVTKIEFIAETQKFILSNATLGRTYTGMYDRVIVATTTRSMEMSTNVTDFFQSGDDVLSTGSNLLLSPSTAESVKQTHVMSSNKVAARIANFWNGDSSIQRTLLCDTGVHQVYTLDYGNTETGVCFITYSWEDDAIKQQALGVTTTGGAVDKTALYDALLDILRSMGDEISAWADNLEPLDGDYETNVQFIQWQREPHFFGAFKFSQPGQDSFVQTMFYDFQKAGNASTDTGVYLAGDSLNWCAGWIEGALQCALNAAAGVIKSVGGTLNGDANGQTPMDLDATLYNYSGDIATGS